MKRIKFKIELVRAELTHWQAAVTANEKLPEQLELSESDVSRIVAGRKTPCPEQAEALAAVLDCAAAVLFPELAEGGAV